MRDRVVDTPLGEPYPMPASKVLDFGFRNTVNNVTRKGYTHGPWRDLEIPLEQAQLVYHAHRNLELALALLIEVAPVSPGD